MPTSISRTAASSVPSGAITKHNSEAATLASPGVKDTGPASSIDGEGPVDRQAESVKSALEAMPVQVETAEVSSEGKTKTSEENAVLKTASDDELHRTLQKVVLCAFSNCDQTLKSLLPLHASRSYFFTIFAFLSPLPSHLVLRFPHRLQIVWHSWRPQTQTHVHLLHLPL